jgi:co-chaperonin GroES (HSP10)
MIIHPTRNNILIEESTQTSGFTLPTERNDGLRRGKVVAVGDFVYHICGEKIYPECKVGDEVLFVFNGNEQINDNGKIYYLIIFDQLRSIINVK